MKVLDPGHKYILDALDGDNVQHLQFVKREGPKYPGNVGTASGTTVQEVLRALIERCTYVNKQDPCGETHCVTSLLVTALLLLEQRAARRHGHTLETGLELVVSGIWKCRTCGHVDCRELEHKQ